MDEKRVYFLSGGVLFFALIQAASPNGAARDHREGVKDDHSEPILMQDWIYTFTGGKNYGAAKDTSQYKECLSEGSCNVPFNDIAAIAAYDDAVHNRYEEALRRMEEFVAWHIDPDRRIWLVKAILDIVENDVSIPENALFFIRSDGISATKSDIRALTDFELPAFLVGVTHYILVSRHGQNGLGLETLNAIGEKKRSKPRVYKGHLGEGILRPIGVQFMTAFRRDAEESEDFDNDDHAADPLEPDAIIQDEGRESGQTTEDHKTAQSQHVTVIQQQINVIQNGDHNANVTNNGTMTINL